MNSQDGESPARAARQRAFLLAALLVCEYLALSFTYDAIPNAKDAGAWRPILGSVGAIAPAFLLVVAVLFAVLGGRVRQVWLRSGAHVARQRLAPAWLGAHFLCFGAFVAVTHRVFGPGEPVDALLPWVGGWLLSGAGLVLALLLAAMIPGALMRLVIALGPYLATGVGLGVSVWLAGLASAQLWDSLGTVTLYTVATVLQYLVSDLVFDPALADVGSTTFYVRVAPVCSGYEGLGLITVFLAAYVWMEREALRLPRAWLLIPIGALTVLVGNVMRIVALILVGIHVSPQVALGGFHSKAGWLFFCAIGLGLVAWSRRSPWFSNEPASAPRADNPVSPYVLPLLAVIAAALISGLFSTGFDRAYVLRVLAGAVVLFAYRHRRSLFDWRVSLEAAGVGALVFVLWLGLSPAVDPSAFGTWRQSFDALPPPERSAWVFFKLVGSVVLIPIVEERAFRGYLLRRLASAAFEAVPLTHFRWWPVLASSLAFGALHQEWIAGTVAGVLFAFIQARRGNLGEAIFAHAVSNALIAVWALGLGRMDLWM